MGQPEEGAFTVVEPAEVEIFCFRTTLTLGYTACEDQRNCKWIRPATDRDEMRADVVGQNEGEAGRVGSDGGPSDILTLNACLPNGSLSGYDDRSSPGIDGEEDGEKDRKSTHSLDRKGGTGMERREEVRIDETNPLFK